MHCTQIARHFTDDFSAGRCRIGTRQLLTCKEKQAVHGLFAVATSTPRYLESHFGPSVVAVPRCCFERLPGVLAGIAT